MNQAHRILSLSILRKEMTSSGIPLNHPFHGVRGMKFIDSLMYFIGHFSTIGSLSLVIGIFPPQKERYVSSDSSASTYPSMLILGFSIQLRTRRDVIVHHQKV